MFDMLNGVGLQEVVFALLGAVATYFLVKKGFALGDAHEDRKREAVKDAAHWREEGVPFLPEVLENWAFDDYSGIVKVMKDAVKAARDPVERAKHRDNYLKRQLEKAVNDPEKRVKLAELMEAAKKTAMAAATGGPPAAAVTAGVEAVQALVK
jgi:hypothetical protein